MEVKEPVQTPKVFSLEIENISELSWHASRSAILKVFARCDTFAQTYISETELACE